MIFKRKIGQTLFWMRVRRAMESVAQGMLTGAVLLFGAVLIMHTLVPAIHVGWLFSAVTIIFVLVCVIHYMRGQITPFAAALALDSAYNTRERFVTALHALQTKHPYSSAIISDAERYAATIDGRRAVMLRFPRSAFVALAILAASAVVHWGVPEFDLLGHKHRHKVEVAAQQAMHIQAKKLEQTQRKLEAGTGIAITSDTRKLVAEMAELRRGLEKAPSGGTRDAMAKLSSLSDRMEQQKQRMREQAQTSLKKEEKPPAPTEATARLERALKHGDMKTAREELARLQQQAGSGDLSETKKSELGKELSSLSAKLEGQAELATALSQAGQAIKEGQPKTASSALSDATKSLDKIEAAQKEMAKLDEAVTQMQESKDALSDASNASSGEECSACNGKGCSACNGTGTRNSGSQSEQGTGKDAQSSSNQNSGQPGDGQGNAAGQNAQAAAGSGKGSPGTKGAQASQASLSQSQGQGGQGKGSGAGAGGRDWGVGTTNLGADKAGPVAEPKAGSDRQQSGRNSTWTEDFVKLYDARSIATQQYTQQAKGKMGQGQFIGSVDVEGKAGVEAPKISTRQAFMDYREAQKDALGREDIPVGYKEYVKNYFDSIEPPK